MDLVEASAQPMPSPPQKRSTSISIHTMAGQGARPAPAKGPATQIRAHHT